MLDNKVLKTEELAAIRLRSLYKSYGYLPFKMSKFEEYDLYVRNKDFLVSDRVITFNDTDGKLLALKPDVTLSIIKNTKGKEYKKHKVYYSENVYRVSGSTGHLKEIMQTGLECIGDISMLDVLEVVMLAADSLAAVSEDYVLDISHMGIVTALLAECGGGRDFSRQVTELIAEKNSHEIAELCAAHGIPERSAEKLSALARMYGDRATVISRLAEICDSAESREALSELTALDKLLTECGASDKIRFDFSVVNNMKYYNGIVFKGFISGIFEGILAGGEYGNLLKSMKLSGRGIGFALYLDLLCELDAERDEYDADVLLLYGSDTPLATVHAKKRELIADGKTVYSSAQTPDKLKFRETVKIN